MTQVEIEYCVSCGLLDDAQDTQKELLEEFGKNLDSVSLKTGDGGAFKIYIKDSDKPSVEKIYDKNEEGYNIKNIKNRVAEKL